MAYMPFARTISVDMRRLSRAAFGRRDGRLVSLGYVNEMVLDSLIVNASAILLPIEYESGSNLKTAEALWAGRPVIATSVAFRGFTEFQARVGVTMADTPELFETARRQALSSPLSPVSKMEGPSEVLWEATLDPIIRLMQFSKLVKQPVTFSPQGPVALASDASPSHSDALTTT